MLEQEEVEPGELIQKAAERLNQNALERGINIGIEAPARCLRFGPIPSRQPGA